MATYFSERRIEECSEGMKTPNPKSRLSDAVTKKRKMPQHGLEAFEDDFQSEITDNMHQSPERAPDLSVRDAQHQTHQAFLRSNSFATDAPTPQAHLQFSASQQLQYRVNQPDQIPSSATPVAAGPSPLLRLDDIETKNQLADKIYERVALREADLQRQIDELAHEISKRGTSSTPVPTLNPSDEKIHQLEQSLFDLKVHTLKIF